MRWRSLSSVIADHEGGIWPIELIGTIAYDIGHPILKLNLLGRANNNSPIIELIGNTDVTISQLHSIRRQWCRVAVCRRVGEVLEDHLLIWLHLNDAGMTRISDQRIAIR